MASTRKILIVTKTPSDPSNDSLFESSDEVKQVDVEELLSMTETNFDAAFVIGVMPSEDAITCILQSMKAGSTLVLENVIPDSATEQALSLELQLAGFMDISAGTNSCTSSRFITCQKPSWTAGECASIKVTPTAATSTWKMDTGDLAEEDLVDENELLADGIVITPGAGCGVDASGAPGKKRACKNCSCGLAEIEAQEAAGVIGSDSNGAAPVNKSACGNCYKGDAFRCASCPFLGKPAFEPDSDRVLLAAGGDDL